MARYIDAEALSLDIRRNLMPNVNFDGTVFVNDAEKYFLNLIEKQSTADAMEVKHGEWITDEKGIVICSECGEEHTWDEYRATYCEDCGAKMYGRSDA